MVIYQKFLTTSAVCVILTLCCLMGINYYIDPANQFFLSHTFDEKLAEASLANKTVMLRTNYNERSFKKLMLAKLPTQPDVIVFGSSRVMPINHQYFNTNSFYNIYVTNPAATIQDDIALYYLYQKRGWKPKTVIIGLDTWILARNNGKEGWKALLPEYYAAKRMLMGSHEASNYLQNTRANIDKYSQLLSFDYFLASIQKMRASYHDKNSHVSVANDVFISTDNTSCPNCEILYPDGSKIPSQKEEMANPAEVAIASRNVISHVAHDNSYTELDPEYKGIFENFIQYLASQKINIILYLPPYEPNAYHEMEKDKNYQMVDESEKYFRSIAAKYHLQIIGSYNPRVIGLDTSNFYNSNHLKKSGFDVIFNHQVSRV